MAKNLLVKEPFLEENLAEEQVREILKCAQDPIYFIKNYVKVQHPSLGAVPFDLRPYQEKIITAIETDHQVCVLMPRQGGKSSTLTGYVLWEACFYPDVTIGIAAHKGSGAKDLIARIKFAYENLPMWIKPGVTVYNVFDLEFDNKSKILSSTTTEDTFRGKSLSTIMLDELGFVKPKIAESFWTSLRPSLTAGYGMGGKPIKLIITSTPNGSEGLFADLWFGAESGDSGMKSIRVYNHQIPGREDEESFKKDMLKTMSLTKYNQEFGGMFISDKGTLISSQILESIEPVIPISVYRDIEFFVNSLKDRRLAVSVDVGEGIGQDNSTIEILDIDSLEQVGEYRDNTSNQTELAKKIVEVLQYLKDEGGKELFYTIEANPIGKGVISLLDNMNAKILEQAEMISDYKKNHKGILTSNKSKLSGCGKLKDLIECGKLKIRSKKLISELKFFVKSGASFKAESGKKDDHVMAMVVMMNLLEELSFIDERVDDNIHTLLDIDVEESDYDSEPMPFLI